MSQPRRSILILNGPNLNLLGERQPEIYGSRTLADLEQALRGRAQQLGCEVEFAQSNSESDIIELIQASRGRFDAVVFNPGAFAHYSLAIADAISAASVRVFEVHISNIHGREEFRRHSVIAPVAVAVIAGAGLLGYELALEAAMGMEA